MKQYTHVCIDKNGVGLNTLRLDIDQNGIQTARQRGIQLAEGSVRLQHDIHVFLWDDSVAGVRRRIELLNDENLAGSCFLVRVMWPHLTEPGRFSSGTLKGDGGQNGPPSGISTNGAWAFEGSIPRRYCYIEGFDNPEKPGFEDWLSGQGWPT